MRVTTGVFGGRWMDELRTGGRFLGGLRPFLKHPLDLANARRRLERQLEAREQTLASILERGVLGNPLSPYRRLFEWAGIGLGDVSTMLARNGLDAALEKLYDAGIYVTQEEFKGRRPITAVRVVR